MAVITDSWCVGITNGKMITYHRCLLNLVYNRFLILAFSFFISCIFAWWNILEQFVLSITEATWSRTLRTPGNPGRAQSSARFSGSVSLRDRERKRTALPLFLVGSVRPRPWGRREALHWHCPKTWGAAVFLRQSAEGALLTLRPHFLPCAACFSKSWFYAKGGPFWSPLQSYWVIGCGVGEALRFPEKIKKKWATRS